MIFLIAAPCCAIEVHEIQNWIMILQITKGLSAVPKKIFIIFNPYFIMQNAIELIKKDDSIYKKYGKYPVQNAGEGRTGTSQFTPSDC